MFPNTASRALTVASCSHRTTTTQNCDIAISQYNRQSGAAVATANLLIVGNDSDVVNTLVSKLLDLLNKSRNVAGATHWSVGSWHAHQHNLQLKGNVDRQWQNSEGQCYWTGTNRRQCKGTSCSPRALSMGNEERAKGSVAGLGQAEDSARAHPAVKGQCQWAMAKQ